MSGGQGWGGWPAGWYPDPSGTHAQRWWDGQAWTPHGHGPLAPAFALPPVPEPTVAPAALPERRLLRAEIVVVMAVGIMRYTLSAIAQLVRYLSGGRQTTVTNVGIVGHTAIDVVVQVVLLAGSCIGVALVWYVLARSNESFRTIGLSRDRLLPTIGRAVVRAFLMLLLAIAFGALVSALHVHPISRGTSKRVGTAYLPVGWMTSIQAGLVEEVFVVGYLLHRLRQVGWSDRRALWTSIAIRSSYHLYGGLFLTLFNLPFGWFQGRIWQKTNRLTLVVLTHVFYDATLFTIAMLAN